MPTFPDFSYHYHSAFGIHQVFIHHHCPSHTNPVESQDHQPTSISDMRHLNNRIIFLHLCVLVVPLSRHSLLLHHWAMILNRLLIYVAASYMHVSCLILFEKYVCVSRLSTHPFSKRFHLLQYISHGLLSRILTCRCYKFYDVLGFGESEYGRLSQHSWIYGAL